MSIDATRWAWQQQNISPTQKLVLLSMADRSGEDHTCWPSIARLSLDTGISGRAIQKAIAALEAMGLVRRMATSGKVNRYALIGVSSREMEHAEKMERSQSAPRTSFTPEPDSPQNDVHRTPEAGSPDPSPEPRSPHPRTMFTQNL